MVKGAVVEAVTLVMSGKVMPLAPAPTRAARRMVGKLASSCACTVGLGMVDGENVTM